MPSQGLKHWFPHLPGALDRAPMAGLMCAGALLLGVALAGARTSNENRSFSPADASADAVEKLAPNISEKAPRFHDSDELVNQVGRFSMSGDRVVFIAADGQQLIALENLPLQQVAKTIDGNTAPLQWIVSGKVTEYRGANFLLLSRAERVNESKAVTKP